MKKLFIPFLVTMFLVVLSTSCKKDRNCVCTSVTDASISFTTVINDTKSNAKKDCSAKSATITDPTTGQTYGVDCVIK